MNERAQANSASACKKIITSIARSAVKLNETIHNAALLVSEHARNFGDTTQAALLVDAVPLSHRRSLIINWFDAFTPISVGKDGKTGNMKAHLKGKAEERDAMWQLEAGKATPFYAMPEAAKEPDMPTYDSVLDNVVAFVKRMENKVKGTQTVPGIQDAAEREKAQGVIDNLKAALPKQAAAA